MKAQLKRVASTEERRDAVLILDPNRVRPFSDQPREYFDPSELVSLELSIKQRGQLQPAMVRLITDDPDHDYELVDGQRRWHACVKLGEKFRAVLIDPEDEEDQFEISVAANFQRASHTPMEIAKAIERMITQGGRTTVYVATIFGKTDAWVVTYRSLNELIPEIQELVEPTAKEPLAVSVAYNLSRLPKDQQRPTLEEIKARGLNATRAIDKIRRILLDGAPETRNPKRGSDKADRKIRAYIRRTIQAADHLFDRLAPEDFQAIVAILVKNRGYDDLKDNVMTAIGRLETIHRRLVDCRTAMAAKAAPPAAPSAPSAPAPPIRSHATTKGQKPEFVYSHPMRCPKCLAPQTRFRRRADADPKRDSWTCQVKGCELKISNYHIKTDPTYQPTAAATGATA